MREILKAITKNSSQTQKFAEVFAKEVLKKYGKFQWSWLSSQLRNKSMERIIKEHWVVEKLLQNCKKEIIPDKINRVWRKYAKNNS